jgi:integrase
MSQAGDSRRSLTLWRKAYKPDTTRKYDAAVLEFCQWCRDNRERPSTFSELDDALAGFIEDLYDNGGSKSKAANALYGMCALMPRARAHFSVSRMQLRGWNNATEKSPHPPLTFGLTCAIAVRMALDGKHRQAVATLLAFDCFLRIGELVNLRKEDISLPGDARVDAGYDRVGLRLRQTKTGPNKFVAVHDPAICALLIDVAKDTRKGARLFPWSAGAFRAYFKRTCGHLGLSPRYVPHSLRHGGATYWFSVLGKSIPDIMQRGRWAAQKSAEHYIQQGPALALSVEVPEDVAIAGKRASKDILLFLHKALHLHDRKTRPFRRARV